MYVWNGAENSESRVTEDRNIYVARFKLVRQLGLLFFYLNVWAKFLLYLGKIKILPHPKDPDSYGYIWIQESSSE